jgi:hypothetical protein
VRSLLSQDTLRAIIDAYAAGASHAASARSAGVSPRVFWRWVKASKENPNDPDYMIDFLGDGNLVTFERCLVHARRLAHLELRSRVEADNLRGYVEVPIRFQGAPVWKPDATLVGKPWLVELLGLDDELLRDECGACIEMTERRQVPWVQVLASLSHAFPDEFVETKRVESTILNLTRGASRPSELIDNGPPRVPENTDTDVRGSGGPRA